MPVQGQFPTNLTDIFNQGHWSLLPDVMAQQTTAQKQAEANLTGTQLEQDQSRQEFPFKLKQTQALTEDALGRARASNALAATHEDELKILQSIPQDQRVSAKLSALHKQMSDDQKAMLGNEMEAGRGYAAAALANGGTLPLGYLQKAQKEHPGLMPYLTSPDGIKKLAQTVNGYYAMAPDRQQAESIQKLHNQGTANVASIQGKNAIDLEQKQFEHGKYLKSFGLSLEQQFNTIKSPRDAQAKAIAIAEIARETGDDQKATYWTNVARSLDNAVAGQNQAIPKPGTVDITGVTQGQVPTQPVPSTMPSGTTSAPSAGSIPSFASEAEATAAQQAGKLKPGQIIMINGRKAKVH